MLNETRLILKRARREKGLTQMAVAEQLNVTLRTYQRYESGERKLSLAVAAKLAFLLSISIYDLVGHDSTTDSPETEEKILENSSA